jgi:hypothetical protein
MLGRDGERTVGQFLDPLRDERGRVFHDVPGDGFNLDHVVIWPHGIYATEMKTWSKPWPSATITVEDDNLVVAGGAPDSNPIEQAKAAARCLERFLTESTCKQFDVRGAVVFPGWTVETRLARGAVWGLQPKMLPAFVQNDLQSVAASDGSLAAYHLSRCVQSVVKNNGWRVTRKSGKEG